jgi:hypothetical protein
LSALLDERFILIADAPTPLVGGELLRANLAGTGLELIAAEDIPDVAHTFLDLTDTPATYVAQSGKIVRVKGDESGLEFVSVSALVDTGGSTPTLLAAFLDLTDTPNSYAGANGYLLRVSSSSIVFTNLSFLLLDDAPASYGAPGTFLRVNGSATGLVFVTRTLSFLGLDDTPGAYGALDGGRVVRVNGAATGLEFTTKSFLDQTDTPSSFAGQAGRTLRVNGAATGVTFAADTFTTFISLLDTPSAYGSGDGGKFVAVAAGPSPTSLVFASAGEIAAQAQGFLTLTDTPDSYTDAVGRFVRVTPVPSGPPVLRFADVAVLASDAAQADLNLYKEEYQGGVSPSATGGNSVAIGQANVASGTNSAVIGGRENTASSVAGVVIGGFTNMLSGPGTIVGGTNNTITATTNFALIGGGQQNAITNTDRAIIGTGLRNAITGSNSAGSVIGGGLDNSINLTASHGVYSGATVCGGQRNIVSGDGAVVLGGYFVNVTAPWSVAVSSQGGRDAGPRTAVTGDYSVVLGPQGVTDRGWFGARPFANEAGAWRRTGNTSRAAFLGEIQSTDLLFAGQTEGGDWTRLLLDSGINYAGRRDIPGGYLSRIVLPADDGVYWVEAEVVARDINAPHSATFNLRGTVMVSGGQATLPSGFEVLSVCRCGGGSAGWDARITNDGLAVDIEVKGGVSQTIKWICKVKTLELMIKTSSTETFTLTPTNAFVDGWFTVNERVFGASILTISRPGGIAGFTFTPSNSSFEVTSEGVFKLRDVSTLNFETNPFVEVVLYITSSTDSEYFVIPIQVLDVPEAPTNIILTDISTGSTTARAALSGSAGARIAYVNVVDPDIGDTHTLSVMTNTATFEIVKENVGGVLRDILKLKSGVSITTSRTVQIRATDSSSLFRTQSFTVGVRT